MALENGTGAKFKFVPYRGSGPAQEAAVTGEVKVIVTSLAEQQGLIKGGQLKPLAMLVPEAKELDGIVIPSAFDTYPNLSKYLPLKQAIGFAVRADAPDEVKQVRKKAFAKAMQSEKVKKWAAANSYDFSGLAGEEASKEFARLESQFAWTLWKLGAAAVDPAQLGIPKP